MPQAMVDAFAAAGNPGVVGIDGQMYDIPHLKRAERLLARARAAGVSRLVFFPARAAH